jgi:hypothetical protein
VFEHPRKNKATVESKISTTIPTLARANQAAVDVFHVRAAETFKQYGASLAGGARLP